MMTFLFSKKRYYIQTIKYLIGGVALYYIYYRLTNIESLRSAELFRSHDFSFIEYSMLVLTLVLVFINWGIESYKWKLLVKPIENISFFRAFKATLAGIAVGLFTVNRIGEFGGRVLFVKPENRVSAGLNTIMGSFSQLLVTMIFGGLAFIYIGSQNLEVSQVFYISLFTVAVAGSILLMLVYYNYSFFWEIFQKTRLAKLIKQHHWTLVKMPKVLLNRALFLSFFRYLVFNLQYILLLKSLGIEIGWMDGFLATSCVFFVQTAVPTVAFFELSIRGAGALLVFSFFSGNEGMILLASFLLWVINLILPALFGLMFFLSNNIEMKASE